MRDPNGNDSELTGYVPDAHAKKVLDARDHDMALQRNGFTRLHAPLDPSVDFLDHDDVVRRYDPDCEALMISATGASHVFAFVLVGEVFHIHARPALTQ
ncbi:MAG: hypothetical protein KTR31_25060 [Myxococcales bacterium]|nr:hypothetical protein [Myxococcales bacterium]